MIYDLAQPLYNNGPQFPEQPPNTIHYYQLAHVKGAAVERVTAMTHSGSHIDGPFHYEPQLQTVSELPLAHFYGPCAAIDFRPIPPKHPIGPRDLRKHEPVTAVATLCSGAEAWYSHYKDNFKNRVQWSPVLLTPLLAGSALASLRSKRVANTLLPLAAGVAMLDGTAYHLRGIARRPGGLKKPLYNTLYGPPIFAPMLFAACGLLGMLAYLMRREREP